MRIHRLTVEAFGPFAERVDVDFDAVSEAGIFLVHGPTGSGKTSLLDAVCFALYSRVPGSRPAGATLRSDHAGPEVRPEVTLELTAGGRRWRVTRSPEHLRPKRRGAGSAKVKAFVRVEVAEGPHWRLLTTGADEAGELLRDAIGMGLDQFAKVVLLPQGDFAAFLRATAEMRRELLERLFDVSHYTDVEDWLGARRRESAGSSAEARQVLEVGRLRLRDLLARLPTAPSARLSSFVLDAPDGPAVDDAAVDLDAGLADLRVSVRDQATESLAVRDRAESRLDAAQTAASAAGAVASAVARGETARAILAELDLDADTLARVGEVADAARRAERVAGDLRALESAVADDRAAENALDAALARVTGLGLAPTTLDGLPAVGDPQRPDRLDLVGREVAALLDALARGGEQLDHAVLVEAQRAEHDQARARAAVEVHTGDHALGEADAAVGSWHTARTDAQRRIEVARTAARDAESCRREAGALATLATLRVEADEAGDRLRRLTDSRLRATEAAQEAAGIELDLRRRRLDGMAGELAERLSDGQPCPVCGGCEHPSPARRADRVTEQEIADARAAWEPLAEEARLLGEQAAAAHQVVLSRTADLAGESRSAGELHVAAAEAARRAQTAEGAAAALERAEADLARVEATLVDAERERVGLRAARAEAQGRLATLQAELRRTDAALARLTARHAQTCVCSAGGGSATQVRTRHTAARAACDALVGAVDRAVLAAARVAGQREVTDRMCAQEGFAGVDDAAAARLDPGELAVLLDRLADAQRRRDGALAVLAEDDVAAALLGPPPDVASALTNVREAKAAFGAAGRDHALVESVARDLDAVAAELESARATWLAARTEAAEVARLADTVAGLGPDNVRRMRLSAFVLAGRLERVVELANERLARMGSGRYRLAHSDEVAPGGRRSGLGLVVEDQWTGQRRDTSTLSGGESFMASLALALGLADAVREEAGGLDLQTLFVDEGFGTLDEDSLEEVMGVLDQLREGGRAIGVVSHVGDLRARIPAQIRVSKSSSGSSVSQTTEVA